MTTTMPATEKRSAAKTILVLLLILIIAAAAMWYYGVFKSRPRLAIITANQGPFWEMLIRGAEDSAAKHDVDLKVFRARGDEEDQTRIIQSLSHEKFDGVAIRP